MTPEVLLAAAYVAFLLLAAGALEWMSAHTHRRSLRYRTAGFSYEPLHDAWECPEGQYLRLHELDHERRVARYRAKAHVCNRCPRKSDCTDSDHGREIAHPLDPWPHSEAGRFHRGISLMMVAVAVLILVVELIRHHAPNETALLAALLAASVVTGRWLLRDLRRHPSNFPEPTPSHGLR